MDQLPDSSISESGSPRQSAVLHQRAPQVTQPIMQLRKQPLASLTSPQRPTEPNESKSGLSPGFAQPPKSNTDARTAAPLAEESKTSLITKPSLPKSEAPLATAPAAKPLQAWKLQTPKERLDFLLMGREKSGAPPQRAHPLKSKSVWDVKSRQTTAPSRPPSRKLIFLSEAPRPHPRVCTAPAQLSRGPKRIRSWPPDRQAGEGAPPVKVPKMTHPAGSLFGALG